MSGTFVFRALPACFGVLIFAACALGGDRVISFRQEVPGSLDFDFVLPGESSPACRLLAPETIAIASGVPGGFRAIPRGTMHTIPGRLVSEGEAVAVEHTFAKLMATRTVLRPRRTYVEVELTVRNLSESTWSDVRAEFCLGFNRLPAKSPWANQVFFPGVPLDRDAQGALWFGKISPRRLKYYEGGRWLPLHPSPDDPDPARFPTYNLPFKDLRPASIVALEPQAGQPQIFLLFDAPAQAREPFKGNACLHLVPRLAQSLEPGSSATVRGKAGFHGRSPADLVHLLR
jgi:hypothetical protein